MTVAPLDMAKGYSVFANGGYAIEPQIIERIVDQTGRTVFANSSPKVCLEDCESLGGENSVDDQNTGDELEDVRQWLTANPALNLTAKASQEVERRARGVRPPAAQVLDPRNAFIIQSMLSDVITRGTGRRARVLNRSDLAGKTGTTNDGADTWFNGFNNQLVASVWVGFRNQEPLGGNAYGSNIPLPIWIDFMEDALREQPERPLPPPPGLVTLRIDPTTGQAVAPGSPSDILELFLYENAPTPEVRGAAGNEAEDEIRAVDLF